MRILAIRLKNLASLAGEQVIDFTAEPLASAGLFAITGPTGAGKSTILDALCLALFGSTPRLDSVSPLNKVPGRCRRSAVATSATCCAAAAAAVTPRSISSASTVTATAHAGGQARPREDGRLQASSQSLTDLDSGTLLASGRNANSRNCSKPALG